MSDDTPTQKFDQPGADAPTEVIGGPPAPPADGSVAATAAGDPKSRRLIIILASIGGALLLAVLVLLIVLLTQGSGVPTPNPTPTGSSSASPTPTPTPTPSKTPTPTPTPTPTKTVDPPPDNSARINSFTVGNDEVFCNTSAPVPSPQYISFSWSASNVDQVFFGVDTNDASQGYLFNNLPPSGDTSNFPAGYDPFEFPCPTDSVEYTLTVIGGGKKVSESVTVTNIGDN